MDKTFAQSLRLRAFAVKSFFPIFSSTAEFRYPDAGFAAAEHAQASGRDLITAVVVAYEIMCP
jgi:hypothetical protein